MYFLVLLSALLACAAGVLLNSTEPKLDGRIVGGTETDITSHPYQVSLLISGSHRCSGVIINPTWVVTLASCVFGTDLSSILVMSGSTYSDIGGTIHRVEKIIVHESYVSSIPDYNVAVVQVFPAFTISNRVQPVTLEFDPVPVGTNVVVTGWGATSDGGAASTTLHRVILQITSDSECNNAYAAYGGITDRMICAGDPNGGRGACQGDYGGPLVANSRLVGLYNWGVGCGLPQYPDVYTKVSAVADWIVINAKLYKISAVTNWIQNIPGFQKMPLTYVAIYSND